MEGYIPCECDKSCFGEAGKSMESRKITQGAIE